jgi:hypothetical protein
MMDDRMLPHGLNNLAFGGAGGRELDSVPK